jgi:DedD protein
MEKKKILLVAVSVGIFLVIAIGAAILIFSPRSGASPNAVVMEHSNQDVYPYPSVAPAENVPVYPRLAEPETGYQEPEYRYPPQYPPDQNHVSSDSRALQENNFYINGEGQKVASQEPPPYRERTTTTNTPPQVTINVLRPESATIPVLPETRPAAAKPGAAPKTPAAKPAVPAPVAPAKQPASAKPAAAPSPAKVTAASKPAAPKRGTYDAFWVQAGSFSTKVHADGVKETLSSKGITSIIENRDVEGKTFYRVRIGPYTSQNEANYWLALIQTLNGFEESQVWRSQAQHLN